MFLLCWQGRVGVVSSQVHDSVDLASSNLSPKKGLQPQEWAAGLWEERKEEGAEEQGTEDEDAQHTDMVGGQNPAFFGDATEDEEEDDLKAAPQELLPNFPVVPDRGEQIQAPPKAAAQDARPERKDTHMPGKRKETSKSLPSFQSAASVVQGGGLEHNEAEFCTATSRLDLASLVDAFAESAQHKDLTREKKPGKPSQEDVSAQFADLLPQEQQRRKVESKHRAPSMRDRPWRPRFSLSSVEHRDVVSWLLRNCCCPYQRSTG